MPENLTIEDRYLNLAAINIGEGLTTYGNLRQRNARISENGYAEVVLSLYRAIAALKGTTYLPSTGTFAKVSEEVANVAG